MLRSLLLCLVFSSFMPIVAVSAAESSLEAKVNAIEDQLSVMQKYLYNLNSSESLKTERSRPASIENGVSAEEISEQFRLIRADIEGLVREISSLNEKFSKATLEVERRLLDIEESLDTKSKNTAIIDNLEHQSQGSAAKHDHVPPHSASDASAVEIQFKKAYLLLREKHYADSRIAFEEFIKTYPNSTLASAAHFWIGEIYMKSQEYDKAAVEYLKGYKTGVNVSSGRAPDNLLMLSEALLKIGKRHECCTTLAKLNKEFPESSVRKRAQILSTEAVCENETSGAGKTQQQHK